MEKKLITIQQIEEEVGRVYLLVDKGIVRIIISTVVGNRLKISGKPIWLLILSGSSAGKTSLMDIISKCGKWIVPIDTLTTNTFASGLRSDTESSLLFQANDGVLVFKDFTTLTSMNEEGLREIMGQLRAIYDGSFHKKTGNNVVIDWTGKIGIIAGGTGAAARKMRQFSDQGERFINYHLEVANSREMAIRAMDNVSSLKEKEEGLRDLVAEFVNQKLSTTLPENLKVPRELQLEIIDVADLATMARSPVTMDKKDPTVVAFVGEREQPARMAMMLTNIASALMVISDETELSPFNASILHKTALDSIPVERRLVLQVLAKYREANTKAIAQQLHYNTVIVRSWCNQLDSLKMLDRVSGGKGQGSSDIWKLKDEYKTIICKFENIIDIDEVLQDNGTEDYDDGFSNAYMTPEQKINDEKMNKIYDQIGQEPQPESFNFNKEGEF